MSTQQLIKKNPSGGYLNVMPKSWIDAIKDKGTGTSLLEILQGFNMYFLPYNGNTSSTRCLVPAILRKKGLWITYVKYDGNVYTEWYAADEIDDKSWGDSSNWRIGNNTLVGDITISANGNWVINGTETEFKAVGEKGNTPLLRVANNRLQVSYDLGDTYIDVTNNPVYTKFRWLATTGDTQANNVGRIQASTDEGKTWTNMSNDFTNNLHISRYIGVNESLPTSGIAEGTIYAKGPYYAEDDTLNDNPIYRLWVYAWRGDTLAWQDNGEFTSISAGVVQETGDSETEVMSQKVVTEKLTELTYKVGELPLVWEQGTIEDGTSEIPAGIVNNVGPSRICSSAKFIIGTEIIYSVPEGYHLAISDWDGITSTITHKSGWLNGDGKWIVENINVFFIMSKGSKVDDIDISEGELIDLYVSDSIALMLTQHFIQEGLSDSVDIDNAKNGVLSFTSASVPIGLPDIDYGSGAIVITNRKSNKTLSNWDLQYIITKNNIASRVYFNGVWDNWGVREYGTLRYNKYALFAVNALNVLNDLNNAHLDVIYKLVIVDGYVPNNLPNDYPLSAKDAWLESKKLFIVVTITPLIKK